MTQRRSRFDAELAASLSVIGGVFPPTITPSLIDFMRVSYASEPLAETLSSRRVEHSEYQVPGHLGEDITVSVFRRSGDTGRRPTIVYAHSGGLMFGDRFSALGLNLDWVEKIGAILICPEYRLAPEFQDPYAREDMYAALLWTAENADTLGVDRARLIVAGASSGGGLAAGMALAARDRHGPKLKGQLLIYPMLDDRGITPSTHQFDGIGVWDRVSNETGWQAMLGDDYRTEAVSPYIAPSRANDLTDLPTAYIDVGSAEIFRDEAVAYASALWNDGSEAELHVWPGGFHAFDIFAAHTHLAQGMISTRMAWIEKLLAD